MARGSRRIQNQGSEPSRLRISRGMLKGRWIEFSGKGIVRPTPSRVREAILSIIAPYAATHAFVDLFAGSGVMGFSAWSIGFSRVVMLEQDASVCANLTENARRLGAKPEIRCDSVDMLERLPVSSPVLVYADPPFDQTGLYQTVFTILARWKTFDAESRCLMESERNLELTPPPELVRVGMKAYGRVRITQFCRLLERLGHDTQS